MQTLYWLTTKYSAKCKFEVLSYFLKGEWGNPLETKGDTWD